MFSARFFRQPIRIFTAVLFLLLSLAYAKTFAIGSPYQPGATNDPACAPGETNCLVQIIPNQSGQSNHYLTSDGTQTTWSTYTQVLGGNFSTTGVVAFTTLGTTNVTLPTSGTLSTLAGVETLTNKSLTSPLISVLIGGTTTTSPLTLRSTSGTGTIGADIIFQTGTDGSTEAMRVLNSGNVGIGDTNPISKLTVNGDIRIKSGSGGSIVFADGTTINTSSIPGSAGSLANTSDAIIIGDSDANATGDVILKTASNDRLHILNGGNVGINTATPSALFSVGTGSPFQVTNTGAVTALTYNGNTIPAGSDTIVGRATTDTLTNKSISGSTNTFTNIPNGALTNNSITINGSSVSLGGSVTSLALTTSALSQFAATTSLQLAGVMSDETGSGASVFATSPTLITPALGTPSSGVVTNLTGTASININGTVGATTPSTIAGTTGNFSSTLGVTGITTLSNHLRINGNKEFALQTTNVTGRLAEYDIANQLMLATNLDGGNGQDDATKPSWAVVLNSGTGDYFKVSRKAAGAVGAVGGLLTVSSAGNLTTTGGISGTTGTFSGVINSTSTSDILTAMTATTNGKIINITSTGANLIMGINNSVGGNVISTNPYASYIFNRSNTDLVFGTNEIVRMAISAGGNVGIGTTSFYATTSPELILGNSANDSKLVFATHGTTQLSGFSGNIISSTGTGSNASLLISTDNNQPLVFARAGNGYTSYTESMRIDASGNVGIGNTAPDNLLTVGSSVDSTTAVLPTLRLQGYNISYNAGANANGSYGGMLFNSNTSYGSSARRYLITNALGGSKFAIIRSASGIVDPTLGADGVISAGQADFIMDNAGNIGIGVLSPSTYGKFGVALSNGPIMSIDNWGGGSTQLKVSSGALGITGVTGNQIGFNIGSTQYMTLDSTGYVGIGSAATSPGALMEVSKGATGLGGQILIHNTTEATNNYSALSFANTSDLSNYRKGGIFYVSNETTAYGRGYLMFGLENGASATNVTPSNATSYMTLTNTGVGIGTTSPLAKLDFGTSVANNKIIIGTHMIGASSLWTGIGMDSTSAGIRIAGDNGTASSPIVDFGYYSSDANHDWTNLVRVQKDGSVGIGTTSPGTYVAKLAVFADTTTQINLVLKNTSSTTGGAYTQFLNSADGEAGRITQNASTTILYTASSDQRLKENIVNTHYGLNDLMNIQVSDFDFINDPTHQMINGFIAQQLETVYPEAVHVGGDDPNKNPWSVDYGRLTPLIIQSIQDMNIKVQSIPTLTDQTLYIKIAEFLRGIAERGEAVVHLITADKVQSSQFCAGSTCMDETQLKEVLDYISSHRTVTPLPSDPIPATPTCSDGIQNQDETGIDTGGVCTPPPTHDPTPTP